MQKTKYTSPITTLGQMSMQELQLLRTQWINEARKFGDIEACIKMSRELGETITYPNHASFKRWRSGELVVEYKEVQGAYLSAQNRYSMDKILWVSWGMIKYKNGIEMGDYEKQLVHFSEGDNLGGLASRNIFLPGAWLETIHEAIPTADKLIEGKIKGSLDKKRRALLNLMSAGQEARRK